MTRFVFLALLFATQSVFGQELRDGKGNVPAGNESRLPVDQIQVYRVEFLQAADLASTLRDVTSLSVIAEERTNSLLVQANAKHQLVIKDLIGKLDQPANAPDRVEVLSIKNRNPNEVARRIQELFRNPNDLMVSADIQGHRVLLRGSKSAIDSAERIVDELDKPLPSATVHFAFFQLNETGAEPQILGPIPPDLKDVANELLRFGSPRLIGRTMTASVENEEFQVAGQVAEQSMVEVNCRLTSAAENGAVVMQIRAELALEKPDANDEEDTEAEDPKSRRAARAQMRRRRNRDFSIATTVLAPRGEYVILGGAPHGFEPGQSVVLVVHVPK